MTDAPTFSNIKTIVGLNVKLWPIKVIEHFSDNPERFHFNVFSQSEAQTFIEEYSILTKSVCSLL